MLKQPDFCIFALRMQPVDLLVESVRAYPVNDGVFGEEIQIPRENIIYAIERRVTFQTIGPNCGKRYTTGNRVHLVEINWMKFLRVGESMKPNDELGDLPVFSIHAPFSIEYAATAEPARDSVPEPLLHSSRR